MNPGHDITLEELKQFNLKILNDTLEEKLNSTFPHNGKIFSCKMETRLNLSGVLALVSLLLMQQQDLPAGFNWITVSGEQIPMTCMGVIMLAQSMFFYCNQCYKTSWSHTNFINSCSNMQDLLDYDVTMGWPANE